jgi:hypothetical protein
MRAIRRKVLPGAFSRRILALDGNQHTGLLILPGMNADPRHLSDLRVSAVRPDDQLHGQFIAAVERQRYPLS